MNATTRTQPAGAITSPEPAMPTEPNQATEPGDDASTDEIEQHIAHTRDELGDTVEALAHKLDVKSQAQEKAAAVRDKAGDLAARTKTAAREPRTRKIVAAGAAAAAAIAGVITWIRRR